MTVLVTGAAGFIGSAVAETLCARGESVIGIDTFNAYYSPKLKRDRIARVEDAAGGNFTSIEGDFADAAALERQLGGQEFDRIVHLGAQAGVRYSLENPRAYVEANVMGHLNLLEIARHRDIEHMVYASSSSVYGGNDKVPFSVEDRVDHPYSLYAATKKADELMSETYAHLYRIPLTGLRFFTVYGPWGRPDMMPWLFTDAILAGRPIKVFNEGQMRRDFTYIDDIVAGVIACLDAPPADDGVLKPGGSAAPHALYNIGNNRPEQLMDVIGIIEAACERKAEVEMLPMQPGDVPQTYADIDPIRDNLNFEPTVSAADGFPRFVEWFKRYHAVD